MPHLTAPVLESELAGNEAALIDALTGAVVEVYGDWVRDGVSVRLDAVPTSRWSVGGIASGQVAPCVAFGHRSRVLDGPDADDILSALWVKITNVFQRHQSAHIKYESTHGSRLDTGGSARPITGMSRKSGCVLHADSRKDVAAKHATHGQYDGPSAA